MSSRFHFRVGMSVSISAINTKDYISDREKKEINVNTYLLTSRQVGLLKYHSLSRSTQHVTFEQKRFDKSL
jgi:hypothetical protein